MTATSVSAKRFGTAPVFFTAISTILGAILFLRFGYATGVLGFGGVLLIILIGHMVTIPTALAISEIATNRRVEGGGEYFIISRSFGLNIGATIGIALFLSQAISVAFYVIAFTEAFEPFFNWVRDKYDIVLPRQVISLPAMTLLAVMILKRGANMGVKTLYIVVAILGLSLLLFFLGSPTGNDVQGIQFRINNPKDFFTVFAICFPAFTGMTAGVGLSGDLKNPGKSIPLGTTLGTLAGMIMYVFIAYKLATSASTGELTGNQLVMSNIALFGILVIPLGLAASTISSAIGSVMVAPRTLQALGADDSFPLRRVNRMLARGKGAENEPFNASVVTILIAFVFVALGDVNAVAQIISMFFMVTYGSLCLISFLNHFGASPSYRPTFRSRWYLSLIGFLLCLWLMFKMNSGYALAALVLMSLVYMFINFYHKDRQGLEAIFRGALFQFSRRLHVFLQGKRRDEKVTAWRPAALCISSSTFEHQEAFDLLTWISDRYGFGTYLHLIDGYYSKETRRESEEILNRLVELTSKRRSHVYVDTLISPSYTSAIAQAIQLPGISGMDNNMVIFDFDKSNPVELERISENIPLVRSGNYDICVLGTSDRPVGKKKEIHVWIHSFDAENANLMILLSYIILGHRDWRRSRIRIFDVTRDETTLTRDRLTDLVKSGRLPITERNINVLQKSDTVSSRDLINEFSSDAGLVITGFNTETLKSRGGRIFAGYDNVGDILFVNSHNFKSIE